MTKEERYDYHLANIMAAMVKDFHGETSLICDSDIEAAKVIAKSLCDKDV